MYRIFLSFLVFSAVPAAASADYQAGRDAYDNQDYAAAFENWTSAADSGDAQSQFALAKLYEQGQGVPQNFVRAHLFYNLAGSKGLADARDARDALAAKMSINQVAEAQSSALDWHPVGKTEPDN